MRPPCIDFVWYCVEKPDSKFPKLQSAAKNYTARKHHYSMLKVACIEFQVHTNRRHTEHTIMHSYLIKMNQECHCSANVLSALADFGDS